MWILQATLKRRHNTPLPHPIDGVAARVNVRPKFAEFCNFNLSAENGIAVREMAAEQRQMFSFASKARVRRQNRTK
jgi:hypothetical protein